jgi:hypothetical protein
MIVETNDIATLHRISTIYSTFDDEIEPIIDVTAAAQVEAEGVRMRERILQPH